MVVHQETDRAELHAEDRLGQPAVAMLRLQHEAVAAERDEDVGILRRVLAMHGDERSEGALRFVGRTGQEGETGRIGHAGEDNPPSARSMSASSAATRAEALLAVTANT